MASAVDDSLDDAGKPLVWEPDRVDVELLLCQGEIDDYGLIPWGSNYTFLVTMRHPEAGPSLAIYKPQQGESPLYDFPDGTLYRRERAAYLVSQALGWRLVLPTVIREGPYGIGMVQLFVDADERTHYFTFGDTIPEIARRVALFDVLVNNADRKAGHVLQGPDGRIWAIDHGLTFHVQDKLRTVIWDFAGEPIPESLRDDVREVRKRMLGDDELVSEVRSLLSGHEFSAFLARLEALSMDGCYPYPVSYRSVPWPAV